MPNKPASRQGFVKVRLNIKKAAHGRRDFLAIIKRQINQLRVAKIKLGKGAALTDARF